MDSNANPCNERERQYHNLVYSLKVTIYFLGVKICFLGEAYVTWTESNRSSTGASRRRFRGIEEYYKFSYYLMGSDSGK